MKTLLIIKRYKRVNCTCDDMRRIYHGNKCIVAKNSKFGGLYLCEGAKIIKGKFSDPAGSNSYPILIAKTDEVHIEYDGVLELDKIETDQLQKQDIISITQIP